MKRCPNCNQIFDDENLFCLQDGTVLEVLNSSFPDTPTQVLSSFPLKSVVQKDSGKSFYAIFGAMAAVIIGLSAIVFFLLSGRGDSAGENKLSLNQTAANNQAQAETPFSSQNSPNKKANVETIVENVSDKTLPITADEVRSLIISWEKAQDTRNFNAYKVCYSQQQFWGIKRTNEGKESRMNYGQWMSDRRKMLQNMIDVEAQNLEISIEGDTATVTFTQQFQSVNYCDTGRKTLKIKMFADSGAKIIFEELKAARLC